MPTPPDDNRVVLDLGVLGKLEVWAQLLQSSGRLAVWRLKCVAHNDVGRWVGSWGSRTSAPMKKREAEAEATAALQQIKAGLLGALIDDAEREDLTAMARVLEDDREDDVDLPAGVRIEHKRWATTLRRLAARGVSE